MYRQGTGYTALYTCFNNWLQSVPAGTGYTALYTCFSYWLQSVPAGTCYTALYTCFNNWLQSVPAGAGYTALYTCFNLPVTSLQTGCWLHSPYCTGLHPNWLHKKKKKKFASYGDLVPGRVAQGKFCYIKKVVDSQQVFHYVRPGVSHLTSVSYCVPCSMLTRGQRVC